MFLAQKIRGFPYGHRVLGERTLLFLSGSRKSFDRKETLNRRSRLADSQWAT
jgi:hypothetical protein